MRELDEIIKDFSDATVRADTERILAIAEELESMGSERADVHALEVRAEAARFQGDYPVALEFYQRARERFQQLGDRRNLADVFIGLARTHMKIGNTSEALTYSDLALEIFKDLDEQQGIANALDTIGITYYNINDFTKAFETFTRLLAIYQDLGNEAEIARVTSNLGNVHHWFDDYPKALECHTMAAEINRRLGNLFRLSYNLGGIGNVYEGIGDYEKALPYIEEARAILISLGFEREAADTSGTLALCYARTGDHDRAAATFKQAIDVLERVGAQLHANHFIANYAWALADQQRLDEARQMLVRLGDLDAQPPIVRTSAHTCLATIAMHEGDIDTEERETRIVLEIAQSIQIKSIEAMTYKALREISRRKGDLESYIRYNDLHQGIQEEITGANAKAKIAVQNTERLLDEERREKERHRELLYSTLPPSIADRVLRGEQVNDSFEHACVMFVDMVGFTTMTSEMHPDDVVRMLSDIFSQIDAIVARHNVMKIKTIGDAYMAVAFPSESSISEQRMAEAATEILQAASNITSPTGSKLSVRIGIHSGPVTAGVIGSERLQYDVWGDTVNVASRMESTGEAGRIHISSTFASCIKHPASNHAWNTEPRGEIDIKGKGTMSTFWLSVQEPS